VVPSFFRCQVQQDTLVPDRAVVHNRTEALHLVGIQELKRVKSGSRDRSNLRCLNRSRSGFLNCVACSKSERNVRAQIAWTGSGEE